MNQPIFPSVWYATEKRTNSAIKFFVFDDKGSLDISIDKIIFRGNKFNIEAERKNISKISLVSQKINWVIHLISNVFFITFSYFFLLQYTNIIFLIGYLVLINGLGLLVALKQKWICIEYKEQNGNLEKMFLADGSGRGWTGIFGGTKKMYELLNN